MVTTARKGGRLVEALWGVHMASIKNFLIGEPLSSEEEQHQRLRKFIALPVFASDAISSTAYATDEILVVLLLQAGVGAAAFRPLLPIAIIVCVLMAIVVVSYRQTIHAYPSGGGAYIVSRENLGIIPSLIAGSSLLVDYILTVAVSTAAGVAAVTSAFPGLLRYRVGVGLLFLFLLTVGNLRGVRQAGRIFAVPTYMFISGMALLLIVGIARTLIGFPPIEPPAAARRSSRCSRLSFLAPPRYSRRRRIARSHLCLAPRRR